MKQCFRKTRKNKENKEKPKHIFAWLLNEKKQLGMIILKRMKIMKIILGTNENKYYSNS